MAWVYLLVAGVLEVCWAVGLKYTDGFSKLWPSTFTIVAMIFSIYFLASSLKTLPIGTAYAIWTGIGAVGTVIFGLIVLQEPANIVRLLCIALIIIAMIGLKLSSH